jgi:hypothetical protein
MKIIFLLITSIFIFTACNNSNDKKHDDHSGHNHSSKELKTPEDSLWADVMEGHDVGMAKYGKLGAMEKEMKRRIDSISKLPAAAQSTAASYKAQLDSCAKDLSYAQVAMDKWMEEFKMDSAKGNMELRIKYLTDEKMKVGKVKEAILTSLAKAEELSKQ